MMFSSGSFLPSQVSTFLCSELSDSYQKIVMCIFLSFFVSEKIFFYHKNKFLFACLCVGRVSEILGKDKVMGTAKKAIAVLSAQPNQKMLMLVEWLAFLTRDRKSLKIRIKNIAKLVPFFFRMWYHLFLQIACTAPCVVCGRCFAKKWEIIYGLCFFLFRKKCHSLSEGWAVGQGA